MTKRLSRNQAATGAKRKEREQGARPKPADATKRCRICLRSLSGEEGSKEHVYPRWVRTLVRADYPDWQGRSIILKPVCKVPCHEALNQLFEDRAEPLITDMLKGKKRPLDRDEQIALAGWFIKTDLLLGMWRNVMDRNVAGGGYEPPDWERYEVLRRTLHAMLSLQGLPPAYSLVRLAHTSDFLNEPASEFSRPGLASFGSLELGASINVLPGGVLSESFVASNVWATAISKDPERFVQVFPPSAASVQWPPPTTLGLRDVAALRAAWGHTDESVVGDFPIVALPRIDQGDFPPSR